MHPATPKIVPIATTTHLQAPRPESGAGALQGLLHCPRFQMRRVMKVTRSHWCLPDTDAVSPQTALHPSAAALAQLRGQAAAFA